MHTLNASVIDRDYAVMASNIDSDFYYECGYIVLGVIAGCALLYLGLTAALTVFTAVTASMGTLVAVIAWFMVANIALSIAVTGGVLVTAAASICGRSIRASAPVVTKVAAAKYADAKSYVSSLCNRVTQ